MVDTTPIFNNSLLSFSLNRDKSKLKLLVFISILFLFIGLTSAIIITNINPTGDLVTSDDTVNLSYGIDASDGLSSITHSWNGTNYTLYDESLVLFMNFDNRSELGENDTIVKDLSMYGNNGSVVGGENITWGSTYGKYNGAFNFSGRVAHIDATKIDYLTMANNFTVSLFYKQNLFVSGAGILHNTVDTNNRFSMGYSTGDGWLRVSMANSTQAFSNSQKGTGLNYIKNGVWYNIVYTWNNVSGTANLYVNGLSMNDNTVSMASSSSAIFQLGRVGSGATINGIIDDVMIWNRSLSASEISYLYKTQITKFNESYLEYNSTQDTSIFDQPHFLCSNNSTAVEFCSFTQTIRSVNTIKSNFSNSIGIIRDDFYSVGTSGTGGFSSYDKISKDNDCTLESVSDYDEVRSIFSNTNFKSLRLDINLNNLSLSEGVLLEGDRLKGIKENVKWAYDNNKTVLLILGKMPNWLANQTDKLCNVSNMINANLSCNPTNITKYTDTQKLILNYVTNNGEYANNTIIEIWNEASTSTFLNNLSDDNLAKSSYYNLIYNASYISLKAEFPFTKVIPTHVNSLMGSNLITNFLGNFTTEHDGINIAFYTHDNITHIRAETEVNWILGLCTTKSATCNNIYFSEWNTLPTTSFFNNLNHSFVFANTFSYLLNSYPENVSNYVFKLNDIYQNVSCGNADEYAIYKQTNNTYYPPYNVTKNFAHLCPAGATVYVTSGDDSEIKQVSCKKGNMYSIIVINTGTEAKNITLNMSMTNGTVVYPYANLVNYEDDTTTYKVNDGVAQLGVMDSYEILYLYSGVEDGALLRGVFKLNEGEGNTIYDSLQNLSNGVKSGATWINDSILVTLSAVQYTIDLVTGLLTLDTDYLYEYLFVDYDYNKVFGFHVSILNVIAGFLMIVVLGVGIIYVVKYFKNIKELE